MKLRTALGAGTKLHGFIAVLDFLTDEELAEFIELCSPNGETPCELSFRSAKAFLDFRAKIRKITLECQMNQNSELAHKS